MLLNVLSDGSQKYDALVSLMVPAGDANLDGTVNFADFQILQADYNGVNAYWVQGDFNDDGLVNWQDLNILRQDLNPAGFTLSPVRAAGRLRPARTLDLSGRRGVRRLRRDLCERPAVRRLVRDGESESEQPGQGDRPRRCDLLQGAGSPREFLGQLRPERTSTPDSRAPSGSTAARAPSSVIFRSTATAICSISRPR